MHRNDRAVGIRRRISFLYNYCGAVKRNIAAGKCARMGLGKISCNSGCLWCTYGFQHSRILQKYSRILARKRGGFEPLSFASVRICLFTARIQAGQNVFFSVCTHARKFFRLFLKLHSSPNGAAPASFMQGYCNGLPTNKKHFFGLF